MLLKLLNQAQYELLNYPHRKLGYYIARPFKMFAGRDNDPNDKMAYSNAVLAKAMMDYYKKHINTEEAKEIMSVVKRYYGRWAVTGHKIYGLHDAYAGMALIDVHKITNQDKYKDGIDRLFNYVMSVGTDETGALILKNERNKKLDNRYVFAETIGMVCPFLAKYGYTYDNPVATNMAINQINLFLQYGMDEKLVLPYHGYDSSNNMKMGIIGWGQAVGHLLTGMSETLAYISPDSLEYEPLRQAYRRIVDKVEAYQAEGGLYHWQLAAKEGPADTAASAMILYSIGQALENKVIISIHKSRMLRGVDALLACVQEDGSLPGASALAPEFNHYPVVFDAYPWALGPALALMTMVEEDLGEV